MSFIGGLLAQLAGGEHSTPQASAVNPTASTKAVQEPLRRAAVPNVSAEKTNGPTSAGQKRKAEEELERIMAKTPKRNGSIRLPSASTNSKTTGVPSDTKPRTLGSSTTKPVSLTVCPGTSIPVKKTQDPVATNTPKPPPKKGSYAEIVARANAAQAIGANVGIIKHKPVEGRSRKDRLNQRREGKDTPKQLIKNGARDSKNEKLPPSGKGDGREKPAKNKANKPTYKGTARAKPEMPAYRGTARPSNPSPTKPVSRRGEPLDRNRSRSTSLNLKSNRYRYGSEEEEEEGEEVDYESDVSSDMEAAPFELEEEEHFSLRTARKEDEEALKEEMRLKKQKEENKKKLIALAAKRR